MPASRGQNPNGWEDEVNLVGSSATEMYRAMHEISPPVPPPGVIHSSDESAMWRFENFRSYDALAYTDETNAKPVDVQEDSSLSKDEMQRLSDARAAIHLENRRRMNESYEARDQSSTTGGRAAEYIDRIARRIRNERSSTRAYTETAVNLNKFNSDELYMLAQSNFPGITSKSGGGYLYSCVQCKRMPPTQYLFAVNGAIWCAEHLKTVDGCHFCKSLSFDCKEVDQVDGTKALLCPNCQGNLVYGCPVCKEPLKSNELGLGMHLKCIEVVDNFRNGRRRYYKGNGFISAKLGKILKSPRVFGCEIEAGTNKDGGVEVLGQILMPHIGISGDGSLHIEGDPFELQLPRMAGVKAEELVESTCEALKVVSAQVNTSCGMHIHLDGRDIIPLSRHTYPAELIQLWKAYIVFEDVVLSFLPYSRRRNDYCHSLASVFRLSDLDLCDSLLDVEKLWYQSSHYADINVSKNDHHHISRYFGVNLHSLLSNKHLEIRYHSGTTRARRILEWANLHALIMDAARDKRFQAEVLIDAIATSSLKDKTTILFDAIKLAPASREYFGRRQRKFIDKGLAETSVTTD